MGTIKKSVSVLFIVTCLIIASLAMFGCGQGGTSSSAAQQTDGKFDASNLEGLDIVSMKGPTSIGLAYLMQNDWGDYTVVASADEVVPNLIQDKAQIVCIPANLAATLYQKLDGNLRVLDINTLGVLYLVTGDLSIDSIEKLAGHTVYMTGKGTVPEYTVRALLEAAGLSEGDVDLQFKSEPAEVAAILNQDSDAIGILPQPYATAFEMKTRNAKQVMDLTAIWEELTGGSEGSLITGVTVAKADWVDANPDVVRSFLNASYESAQYANEDPAAIAETLVELGIIEDAAIAEAAIPKCNVVCIMGANMKIALSGYLQVLFDQNPASIGGSMPGEDFYYVPEQS